MSSPVTPEIVVEITLLSFKAGSRNGAILQGEYRGVLGVGSEHFSVRFFVPHFPVGTAFTVWEGKVIGNGRVLEVLHDA
jgi:hypothetical protein